MRSDDDLTRVLRLSPQQREQVRSHRSQADQRDKMTKREWKLLGLCVAVVITFAVFVVGACAWNMFGSFL